MMTELTVNKIRWTLRDVIVSAAVVMTVNGGFHIWAKQQIFPNCTAYLLWEMALFLAMILVPIGIIFGFYRQNMAEINWRSRNLGRDAAFALITAVALFSVIFGLVIVCNMVTDSDYPSQVQRSLPFCQIMSLPQLLLFLLFLCLVGPVSEEIFWRGFVYQAFRKKISLVAAIVCQALLFAVYHFRSTERFLVVFFIGLGLGYAFHKRRNLVTPVFIHVCVNSIFAGFLIAGIQSSGGVGSMRWANEQMRKHFQGELADRAVRNKLRQVVQLGQLKGEDRSRHIVPYLGDSKEAVRMLAMATLKSHYKPGDPVIAEALRSSDWKVVDGVLTVVGITKDKSFVPDLVRLTDNEDVKFRVSALFALDQIDALPELITALQSSMEDVRIVAIRSLKRRTNQDFGYKTDDPPEERSAAVRRWQEWWEQNKDAFRKER